MKAYLHPDGHHSRTQADAKATGQPFELIDIPTDHAGLIAYINGVRAAPTGLPELGEGGAPGRFDQTMDIGRPPGRERLPVMVEDADGLHPLPDPDPQLLQALQYRNGDPTTSFMKSRDPSAIFTCTSCGANNRNP